MKLSRYWDPVLWLCCATLMLFLPLHVLAQEGVVPDLSGLNIPQAAAALNRAGFSLGEQVVQPWTDEASAAPGTVFAQSMVAGVAAAPGSAVDVVVLSNARITLLYDDNDLTLRNESGQTLPLGSLRFASTDGGHQFAATRWRGDLPAEDCTQVWSIGRSEPKRIEGCDSIFWLVTNNGGEHFWTQSAGVSQFTVVQDGAVRATCDAAGPGTQDSPLQCSFYVVSSAIGVESTDYIYFAYTEDRLAVINRSADRWMPLEDTTIYNFNPAIQIQGAGLNLSAPGLFPTVNPVATTQRLAPGQCILLSLTSLGDAAPPQPCDVIAQLALSPEVIFWSSNFELDSVSNPERRTCPAATASQLTLCIMPR